MSISSDYKIYENVSGTYKIDKSVNKETFVTVNCDLLRTNDIALLLKHHSWQKFMNHLKQPISLMKNLKGINFIEYLNS